VSVNWNAIAAIASVVSTIAFVLTAVYIRSQLKALEKDRYLNITSELFTVWQSTAFMEAQLWLLHRLEESTWESFVERHRGDFGEAAFHRVGSFYDRVGTLVRMGFVNEQEILSTIGAYAIAVWQKVEPLVREARHLENSVLFDDFERLLPACHECYVPALGRNAHVNPFSLAQPRDRIGPTTLQRRLDGGESLTLRDVRSAAQFAREPRVIPGALHIPADEVEARSAGLPADREVIVYCA
jgi:hypothetical protein